MIAIISSGPNRKFETGCRPDGHGEYLLKLPDNDDVVLAYSFAEAQAMAGGLWNLKQDDVETATIAKNLSVTDVAGNEQLSFDAGAKSLSIGDGGTGNLPNIKTDYIQNLSKNSPIEFLANIKTGDAWISGDGSDKGMKITASGDVGMSGDVDAVGKLSAGSATISTTVANAVAAIVTASGDDGIGLKASGTSKAIEAEGIIDMMDHKIINLATPVDDKDAATKKYVDDKLGGAQTIKCESFVFASCTGAATASLTKTNLGACKKACEAAGVQCCEAEFASLPGNPNAVLADCKGHNAPSQTSGGVRNILTILLGGGKYVSALCYLE